MTAKKKPRTGGDGASSNSLHGDDESWGNFPSPQFYDRAVNIERQPARAAYHTHTRRDDRWAVSACRGPEIRADYDAIMSGLGSWRRRYRPRAQ